MPELIRRASSHCGGHLTWLFTVESDAVNPVWQGSRGVGICIEAGLDIHCTASKSRSGEVEITVVNDDDSNIDLKILYAEVVKTASQFADVDAIHWHFHVDVDLPISQGFGLSAAGALAAARCVLSIASPNSNIVELEKAALSIAHLVERRLSGGLGDVLGLAAGGVERRSKPGAPFHLVETRSTDLLTTVSDKIAQNIEMADAQSPTQNPVIVVGPGDSEGFEAHIPVILCWHAEAKHHTSKYIDNAEWKVRIRNAGADCMDSLGAGDWSDKRWPELLIQSQRFADESGLAIDSDRSELLRQVEQVIADLDTPATALLCMLGQSVSIVPTILDADYTWAESLSIGLNKVGLNVVLTKVENNNPLVR